MNIIEFLELKGQTEQKGVSSLKAKIMDEGIIYECEYIFLSDELIIGPNFLTEDKKGKMKNLMREAIAKRVQILNRGNKFKDMFDEIKKAK